MSDSERPTADLFIDARGLGCPLPLLKAKQGLVGLEAGQRLELLASDPGAWEDIASFVALSRHRLELREPAGEDFRFVLIKG
ncbi:sulfurtransferase TusA family protein [Halotalea alkalilenta]|uniref:UPF0033 domain-containing protein n=1 Tax=Halotalea alkalilenta TaxID=376489 RepID=A0A172YKP1_9GAMM|nr:sulfurtransferase TusA family protein [Halotalea alkalilenta]ANF59722.1 hypothetical protein A5892_16135 [Halotalea alkalilenta]